MPPFPLPLDAYPQAADGLWQTLVDRAQTAPFNVVATTIFSLAILHTFAAASLSRYAHRLQHHFDARASRRGHPPRPSVRAELLHLLGEVEIVFGVWAAVLVVAIVGSYDWETATHYLNDTVVYTEPLFVIVVMALASTRPIVVLAEGALRQLARVGGQTPSAWWMTILTIGPLLGSVITEPGAMTISAMLLARQFYELRPSARLRYATLAVLFVNVSIGGTLTHFAAPPVLMVARAWGWTTPYMLTHVGWRAVIAIVVSNLAYFFLFRSELAALARRHPHADAERAGDGEKLPVPAWITIVHVLFMAWTVVTAHDPAFFLGGFLFFLGFARATRPYQAELDLRSPLLVGFFLAGLVVHGGLQGWWIAPVLSSLSREALFAAAAVLTGFNDNALITYLATLAPNFSEPFKLAVVQGAVTGGGLTVIANAPNPAGQAILGRYFEGAVSPLLLLAWAIPPTLIATFAFRML